MNGLALCSGFGGIELGLESRIDGFKTICHVEGEAYAASLLIKKIQEGKIHEAPVWSDVKTFNGEPWRGKVDIITGGFPCQPHSSAGKLLGKDDPRNLWGDVKRIISEVRPRIIFLENVSNINNTIAPSIVGDLAQMGFDAAWCIVRASDVGAPHRRARWFLMAHSYGQSSHKELQRTHRKLPSKGRGLERRKDERKAGSESWGKSKNVVPDTDGERRNTDKLNLRSGELDFEGSCDKIPDTDGKRSGKGRFLLQRSNGAILDSSNQKGWWETEPGMGRVVDGVAHWVDRLRGLGNGVVPQQAAYAFDILSTALMNQSFDD